MAVTVIVGVSLREELLRKHPSKIYSKSSCGNRRSESSLTSCRQTSKIK